MFDSQAKLDAAKKGDDESLGLLLDQYRPYLHVLAQRYLDQRVQGRVDPQDLVQQTFMEAHRDFGAFRGDCVASLLAWLRNMLRNNVATIHQRHLFAQRRAATRTIAVGHRFGGETREAVAATDAEITGAAHGLDASLAGSAQRVEAHRVLARRQIALQSLAQLNVLLLRQEALEQAVLRPLPIAAQGLMHFRPSLVRTDVIGDDVEGGGIGHW